MRKSVTFRIDIEPAGKKTPGHRVVNGIAMAYKNTATRELEDTLRALAAPHRPRDEHGNPVKFEGPLEVVIVAVLKRPAYLCKLSSKTGQLMPSIYPGRALSTSKPDDDNVAKSLRDALKDWWDDDKQIAIGVQIKQVAAYGESPHYSVRVSEIPPDWSAKISARDVLVMLPPF